MPEDQDLVNKLYLPTVNVLSEEYATISAMQWRVQPSP
jgi:hypothetical protein